ncbi:MAG: peptidylprolyl isomerase [Kofleriaceae bacterium]
MRFTFILIATVLAGGCPAATPRPPRPAVADDVRLRIAQAEARRADGIDPLIELARTGSVHVRMLALRGLGRIGAPRGLAVVRDALADRDDQIVAAAAGALGYAASLDDTSDAGRELTAALDRASGVTKLRVIEAIGRTGDSSTEPMLTKQLAGEPAIAETAALALARFGRRKIAISGDTRAALVASTRHHDARVRYAACYALARERRNDPAATDPAAVVTALVARAHDDVPEVRAIAVAAIARRKLVADARDALVHALDDSDWRVAVEAARALGGDAGDDASRAMVAAAIRPDARWQVGPRVHVVIEALRTLGPHRKSPAVASMFAAWSALPASSKVATGWIDCLSESELARIEQCSLPDHLRLPLVAERIKSDDEPLPVRRAARDRLLAHRDVRVRAAGIAALASIAKAGDDADRAMALATAIQALGATDLIEAGTAVESAQDLYAALGDRDVTGLDRAVIARAASEQDPMMASGLLGLIAERKLAAGAPTCRAALAGDPVRAHAAVECLRAFGESPEPPAITAATPPPLDVSTVIGKRVTWRLETSQGSIEIELDSGAAPWAVAAITTLTRRGFYDGLELHRVVPNFVVQGGDPTMSGWGGPDFQLPAEPAGEFRLGAVGIADAGRDTGGSQWFIMHGDARQLDGRYTWVGKLTRGQAVADALVIGDKVVKATVETSSL